MTFILFLLLLSAFFSASETAFSTSNIIRLRRYKKNNKKGAKLALRLSKKFDRTISTVLVGNNIVNILQTAIATKIFTDFYGINGVLISTVVMTVVILLFGEYIPKNIAKRHPEIYALKFAVPLYVFELILLPVVFLLSKLNKIMSRVIKHHHGEPSLTEEELISVVDQIEEEGVLGERESDLIKSAITFDDITISSIYTKKEEAITISIDEDVDNILKMFVNYHYSRIPIYRGSEDKIVGILYEKDFLSNYIRLDGDIDIRINYNSP